ncbi:MAG TPA: trimeric intracellular cation channel family protein [Longimicrobiaceae bacterium]|nr:trimeric intracellular cation channel family protein [Longimicrobiaceae bacterium]
MLYFLQLLGVAVFAASGALAAGRKRMDLLGVVVIACVTAIGGGTLRDVLLDRHPVFWIADPAHLVVSCAAALLTLLYATRRSPPEHSLAIADALGLGMFTIGGVQIAEQAGVGAIVAVLMGTMTGVAGGVIRDVLSAEIPLIFRKGELYASAAIAGSATYLLLAWIGLPRPAAALPGMGLIVALRLAAILWGLELPVVAIREEQGHRDGSARKS